MSYQQGKRKPRDSGQPSCRAFAQTGKCKYGDNCKFAHGGSTNSFPNKKIKTDQGCREFAKTGQCRFGQSCKFSHGLVERSDTRTFNTAPTPQQPRQQFQQQPKNQRNDQKQNLVVNSRTSSTTMSQITDVPFSSLKIDQRILKALDTVFKYPMMTKVQAQATPVCFSERDVLAKAKTGTGKTIAFLLPALQKLLGLSRQQRAGQISVLILSPTRELAMQIEEECKGLVTFISDISVASIVGGINIRKDHSAFNKQVPDVLIATPGRLNDHLENEQLRQWVQRLQVLIMDEADQLLDMGFRPAIVKTLGMLPAKEGRQTLLFSATMPDDVKGIAKIAMRDQSFQYVDTVGDEESTHQHVPQVAVCVSMENQTAELYRHIREAQKQRDYKIIVFFTTAKLTQFYAELFNTMGIKCLEMHSRKSQPQRKKVSDLFRLKSDVVMFSSDVSARGMDYPDVSKVIQFGRPSDKAQYIHRLGRTARGGKGGSGAMILAEFEWGFVQQLKDLPVEIIPSLDSKAAAPINDRVEEALPKLPRTTMVTAYQAWMGFYNSYLKKLRWNKEDLVTTANIWICQVQHFGPSPPPLLAKTIGKMGLKGIKGILIDKEGGRERAQRQQEMAAQRREKAAAKAGGQSRPANNGGFNRGGQRY